MKVKLLKRLRKIGESKINIYSITTSNGTVTGMKTGYNEDEYKGIFSYGDTEADVKQKAFKIYLQTNIVAIRKKYGRKKSNP